MLIIQNYFYLNECKDIVDFPTVADATNSGWNNTGVLCILANQNFFSSFVNNSQLPIFIGSGCDRWGYFPTNW